MISYRYNAPNARRIFDERNKLGRWLDVTQDFARYAILADDDLNADQKADRVEALVDLTPPPPGMVEAAEAVTGHDVVAFLSIIEKHVPADVKPYLHYGLTSSDVVDNAHFQALRMHARDLASLIEDLVHAITSKAHNDGAASLRAGRTHGQIADLTTWGHQLHVQLHSIRRIEYDLESYAGRRIYKSAGPTGKSPLVWSGKVASEHEAHVVPSTQVIPRDYQVEWAALYLRLAGAMENLALLVRLGARSEVGELREGASADRVGSSAMPHKRNPIDSEKVCGLAKVARGYFSAIAEGATLWEDRDLSNSSLERIVVPDLATVVEHQLSTMIHVMSNLHVDYAKMRATAQNPRTMSNILQTLAQKHFRLGPVEAGNLVREYVKYEIANEERLYINGYGIRKALDVTENQIRMWANDAKAVWEKIVEPE